MGPPFVRACGTSLVRWMALQCAKRTASRLAQQCAKRTASRLALQCAALKRHAHRLALQCAALKRHARRLALQCASVREAHCAQATVARLATFESLKWKYSFATNSALFIKIRIIAIREVSPPFGEEHRRLEQDISFPGNNHLLILRKCYAVHINASSL